MGSRGQSSSRSKGEMATSNRIKNEMIQKGLNSKIVGVRKRAEKGEGTFHFKDAKAVKSGEALKMQVDGIKESDGKTVIDGYIGQKHVFFASNSNNKTIQKLKNKKETARQKRLEEERKMRNQDRPRINTTTTYDRWKKRHDANFDAWFGNR